MRYKITHEGKSWKTSHSIKGDTLDMLAPRLRDKYVPAINGNTRTANIVLGKLEECPVDGRSNEMRSLEWFCWEYVLPEPDVLLRAIIANEAAAKEAKHG